MTGKITAIDQNGVFSNNYGTFNKFRVTMATGVVYNFNAKDDFKHSVGDEVSFEVTNEQYNAAKLIVENNFTPKQNKQSGNKDEVQKFIIRQSSIASACNYLAGKDLENAGRDILELAKEFENFVYNG